jgi:hypothetical protein
MATISRYSKDTLKNQVWETCIIEDNNVFKMYETHLRRDKFKVIKEVEKIISKEEADQYKEKNKEFHIETYKT